MASLQTLFSRKMDRREFLIFLGIAFLAVTGISGMVKRLSSPDLWETRSIKPTQGFGLGPYGGTTRKENS